MQVKSRRSFWAVGIFLVMFLLIAYIRIGDFQLRQQAYLDDLKGANESVQSAQNYSQINPLVIKPVPLFSIFHEGVTGSAPGNIYIPYFTPLEASSPVNLAQNYLYKFDSRIDISFLVCFFLSLLILISAFDAVNGEKELGQLRLIFVYPVTRAVFLWKKITGIALFAYLVFFLPYLTTLLIVSGVFGSLADEQFWSAALIYALLTLLFVLAFTLIGILISLLSRHPARSLVYALSVWLFLAVIAVPLYDLSATGLSKPAERIALKENLSKIRTFRQKDTERIPKEINPDYRGHQNWNGGYTNSMSIFADKECYDVHVAYIKHYYKDYYRQIQDEEQLAQQIENLKQRPSTLRKWILGFNPVEIFNSTAGIIADNDYHAYQKIYEQAISLRNDWTGKGIKDGWLFSYRFFQMHGGETYSPNQMEFAQKYFPEAVNAFMSGNFNTVSEQTMNQFQQQYYTEVNRRMEIDKGKFKLPADLPVFQYHKPSAGQLIKAMLLPVSLLALLIVILAIPCQVKFRKYDLR